MTKNAADYTAARAAVAAGTANRDQADMVATDATRTGSDGRASARAQAAAGKNKK